MSERHLIVVDVETTGLDTTKHVAVEIAAVNATTGDELHFVPWLAPKDMAAADPYALSVNRYYERRVFENQLDLAETFLKAEELHSMLAGNTLAGSNPAFDAQMISNFFREHREDADPAPWHHRLADLAAYAAGRFDVAPNDLPGLDRVCELLSLPIEGGHRHSALVDARLTAECFRAFGAR